MDIIEGIKARRTIRAYKTDPIPKKVLEEIVEACRWAGSPGNIQPWEVAILGGDVMEELRKQLAEKVEAKAPSELDFPSPLALPELYAKRRAKFFKEALGRFAPPTETEKVGEKKHAPLVKGAQLFDAPNVIIIYSDKAFLNIPWGMVSMGLMIQNVCLAALAHGLGTCVMGKLVDYPDLLREILGVDQSKFFLIGIAIGYPDPEAMINSIPRIRIPLEEWVHWHGF